jgi:hypothetical protein
MRTSEHGLEDPQPYRLRGLSRRTRLGPAFAFTAIHARSELLTRVTGRA